MEEKYVYEVQVLLKALVLSGRMAQFGQDDEFLQMSSPSKLVGRYSIFVPVKLTHN